MKLIKMNDRYYSLSKSSKIREYNTINNNITYHDWIFENSNLFKNNKMRELATRTIIIESLPDRFSVPDFMDYLKLITFDLINESKNMLAKEIMEFFKHNIISYFINETKCERFSQVYFLDDCFYLVNLKVWEEMTNV